MRIYSWVKINHKDVSKYCKKGKELSIDLVVLTLVEPVGKQMKTLYILLFSYVYIYILYINTTLAEESDP